MDSFIGNDPAVNTNVPVIGNVPDGMDVVVISTKNLVDLLNATVKETTRAKIKEFANHLINDTPIDMTLVDYRTILMNELESVNLNLDLQELAATYKADQVAKTI